MSAPGTFLGVYDFSCAPYALGDCLTWQENVQVGAREQGYEAVRLCLVADSNAPASRLQPQINKLNYRAFLRDIYPSLFSCPLTTAVQIFQDKYSFNLFLVDALRRGLGSWPSYEDHFNRRLDYTSHRKINAYYAKHGDVPRLTAPRGYEAATRKYVDGLTGSYVVAVNIRQSRMSHFPSNLYRDSPIAVWNEFFRRAAQDYPEAIFVCIGRYGEWDLKLMRHPNVVFMRADGATLGHELALVHSCDLFMGTSSGFATAATFSETPYVITNVEKSFSRYSEVPVGETRYPFARENQIIHWEQETVDFLFNHFEKIFHASQKERTGGGSRQIAVARNVRT